ncbi:Fur-regulated basic protein FbpA [Cytobacillus depressus]|uniref:Fur-regulated basic protein FbpA n=1 Tax=Cytobacillus depressus TaxID=1602942 RepID=A0A6L3V6C2_9BACI|nr:Fur-regulated basic protein FbpA [Cytobacillus depressus]KAB2334823.1 Fur-regulated basic protein FbpA [Cytobacillus depressus]
MENISDKVILSEKQLIIQKLLNMEFYKSSDDRQLYELTLQELKHEYDKYMKNNFS